MLRAMSDMMLRTVEGDRPQLCAICHKRPAIGPCASCHRMICAECSTLTTGGVKTYAICLECDLHKGRSLRRAWIGLVAWLLVPALVLGLVVALLAWVGR